MMLVGALVTVAGGWGTILFYMLKTRDARLNNHSKRLDDQAKEVSDNYVRKDDFNRAVDQFREDMKQMCAKIDKILEHQRSRSD